VVLKLGVLLVVGHLGSVVLKLGVLLVVGSVVLKLGVLLVAHSNKADSHGIGFLYLVEPSSI